MFFPVRLFILRIFCEVSLVECLSKKVIFSSKPLNPQENFGIVACGETCCFKVTFPCGVFPMNFQHLVFLTIENIPWRKLSHCSILRILGIMLAELGGIVFSVQKLKYPTPTNKSSTLRNFYLGFQFHLIKCFIYRI